jgi:hypothetical protein
MGYVRLVVVVDDGDVDGDVDGPASGSRIWECHQIRTPPKFKGGGSKDSLPPPIPSKE